MSRVNPLSVIVVNDFATVTGGTDRVALAEARELAHRGHQVTLLAGSGEPDAELISAGVNVHTTGQLATIADPKRLRVAAQGIWNRQAASLVRNAVADADPCATIVHVHGFAKVLSASVIRAAVDSGLPVVATLHDYFAACPNGGFFNYQTEEVCHLRPLSARCVATHCDARSYRHKLWRVGRSSVQKSYGRMPSGLSNFITPSRFAGEIMQPFLPSESCMHILANPVAAERLSPADVAANDAFVFVGRMDHDKGPAVFARAARLAGIRAVFVGDGPETEAVRLANPDVELRGWLDAAGVRAALREARAVVSASLWYETHGLIAMEAASQGVPAIVSDVSVLRDAVADNVTGLWFRGGDMDHLADQLRKLNGSSELAAELGRAAYEAFWAEERDLGTHVDRLEGIYRGML